jgi:small subunit ribosomal protein S20
MANIKSAIKTIRRISRQTEVNKSRRSKFKTSIKKMNVLIEKKNKKDALAYLPKLNSEIMKIAKTGIIKKRNVSRNLSRITRKINSL